MHNFNLSVPSIDCTEAEHDLIPRQEDPERLGLSLIRFTCFPKIFLNHTDSTAPRLVTRD